MRENLQEFVVVEGHDGCSFDLIEVKGEVFVEFEDEGLGLKSFHIFFVDFLILLLGVEGGEGVVFHDKKTQLHG